MKLPITEVIEQVKDELLCYENAAELATRWEKEFLQWITDNTGKHKDIIGHGSTACLKIKDEDEIFEIADSYLDAIEEGNVKQYWAKF